MAGSERDLSIVAPVRAPSLVELSYRQMRDLILSGEFEPGTRLNELQLSTSLGVSRGTLRMAIRRLADEGIVEERPRQGAFVRRFDGAEIVDIYNLRVGIEVTAVRLAVRRGAPLDRLEDVLRSFHDAAEAGDLEGAMRGDFAFHSEICEMSGNDQLLQVFHELQGRIRTALSYDNRANEDLADLPRRHDKIMEALHRGDERAAAIAVHAHIVGHVDEVLLSIGADPSGLLPPLDS
jgi:DNA-binding GntR family transcriptional regulator